MARKGDGPLDQIIEAEANMMGRPIEVVREHESFVTWRGAERCVRLVIYACAPITTRAFGRMHQLRAVLYADEQQLTSSVVATEWERD